MIVFPCHNVVDRYIVEAVGSARRLMPDEPVLVVDSDSPDRSYMNLLPAEVEVADVKNRGYATGAYWWAYHNRPADFYYLFHDNLYIRADLTHLKERPVTAVRWFPMPDAGWGYDEADKPLEDWAHSVWPEPYPDFNGVFGPMLAVQRTVLDDLADLGFDQVLPVNKWQECAMERLWGVALAELGYDVTDGALQGEMRGYFDDHPSDLVHKVLGGRK